MQGYTLIIHGPLAFDHGDVLNVVGLTCPAEVIIAGIIARAAAYEAGFDLPCPNERPSTLINRYGKNSALLNRGKTPESGIIFGENVAQRTKEQSLIQIECSNETIYLWGDADHELAEFLSLVLSYKVLEKEVPVPSLANIRTIRGCIPGEPVFVNGTIIGTAESTNVSIQLEEGKIIPLSGLKEKKHGIERVNLPVGANIHSLWCKSGPLRNTTPLKSSRSRFEGKIIVIDHDSHHLWDQLHEDVTGILSIGDDTTSVAGHLSSHLGIPVFGITDGDEDGIIKTNYTEGSVIVKTVREKDDDIGEELKKRVPEKMVHWDTWVQGEIVRLGDRIEVLKQE